MKPPYSTHDTVLIINLGGQYAHLIACRVRRLHVYSEIINYNNINRDLLKQIKPKAVILSGGPYSVYLKNSPKIPKWLLDVDIPILGICYGFQLIVTLLGGTVSSGKGEYGRTLITILEKDPLFDGWNKEEYVWMSHDDHVSVLPKQLKPLAISENGYIAAFKHVSKPIYGIQFHPEVRHTKKGLELLRNFLINIASIKPTWYTHNMVQEITRELRTRIKNGKVLATVSGGVDSTVATVLVKKAIGEHRLVPVFINNGLLRENEVKNVLNNLKKVGIKPLYINAEERFLSALKGIRNCEEKRLIIGKIYTEIFKEIISLDKDIKWLVQGTIYPDIIESGAVPGSARIKSHHNVAGLSKILGLNLIEPLKYFYKDEVREIGLELGIPREIIYKHPFPGPGLAVRIIGEVTKEKLYIVRKASKIIEEELVRNNLYHHVWQAFAVVGDDTWVGVKGDHRAVGRIVIVRIVESEDAMTADWVRIPYEILDRISRRITNEVPGVTMVAYSITTKPPSTIEPC